MKKVINLINYLNNNGFKKEAAYLKKEALIGLGTFLFLFSGCKKSDDGDKHCFERPDEKDPIEYVVEKGDTPIEMVKKIYGEELGSVIIKDNDAFKTLIDIVKMRNISDYGNLDKKLKYFQPGDKLYFPNPEVVKKNFDKYKKVKEEKKEKGEKTKSKGSITWDEYKKDDFDMDQTIPVAENFTFREVSDSDTKPKLTGGSKNKLKSKSEFDAHMEAVKILQRIRDEFGPIEVTSGYRGHSLNKAVGGVSSSCHKEGVGFDIKFEDGKTKEYWKTMRDDKDTKWKDIGECFYYQKAGHIHFTAKPCGGDGLDEDWKIFNK